MISLRCHSPDGELLWPEPLVIDLIGDHLERHALTAAVRRTLARQHAAAFRDMLAGRGPEWQTARRRLRERYDALGISRSVTATIDRAVLFELTHVAVNRFRTSPRRRNEAAELLRAAVAQVAALTASERRVPA